MKDLKDLSSAVDILFSTQGRVGDDADRETFFNHALREQSVIDGKPVKLLLDRNVRSVRYKDECRKSVSVPKKLIEQMRALQGLDADDEFLLSTTLVALADFACSVLNAGDKTLRVSQPKTTQTNTLKVQAP